MILKKNICTYNHLNAFAAKHAFRNYGHKWANKTLSQNPNPNHAPCRTMCLPTATKGITQKYTDNPLDEIIIIVRRVPVGEHYLGKANQKSESQ